MSNENKLILNLHLVLVFGYYSLLSIYHYSSLNFESLAYNLTNPFYIHMSTEYALFPCFFLSFSLSPLQFALFFSPTIWCREVGFRFRSRIDCISSSLEVVLEVLSTIE